MPACLIVGVLILAGACSTASAAPFYANETALECDPNIANRDTDVMRPEKSELPRERIGADPADLRTFASYYAANQFDLNFLTWAQLVPDYVAGSAAWAACGVRRLRRPRT